MPMMKTSNDRAPGVRTFQIQSDSSPDTWYTVKRLRQPKLRRSRWLCTCADFMNRKMIVNQHCKHIKRIRAYAQHVGGVSHIPRSTLIDITSDVPMAPRPKLVIKKSQ